MCSIFTATDESIARRVHNHFLVGDYNAGLIEAQAALVACPQSRELRLCVIEALSHLGRDRQAYIAWQEMSELFEDIKSDLAVIEKLAWSVLTHAESSDQMSVHLSSLYGAALTRDVKGAHIILRQLKSSNGYIRAMAAKFAMQYGDDLLLSELMKMLEKERVWYVRLEIMRTLSAHKVPGIEEKLRKIIASERTAYEEKGVAIESLVMMTESIDEKKLDVLLKSDRAGLRQLSCGVMLHLEKREWREKLIAVLDDTSVDVRCMAMQALAYLGIDGLDLKDRLVQVIEEPNPRLAIAAGRLLLACDSSLGLKVLFEHLQNRDPVIRRLAAGVLVASGEKGKWLAMKMMRQSDDPYVRVNLAHGLLGFCADDVICCNVIDRFLRENKENIMWDRTPGFFTETVGPTRARHVPQMAQYPLMIDQTTRLSLYNALAIKRYPKVTETLRDFLKNKPTGVPFAAALTLLEEGSQDALEHVKTLLTDTDELVRLQAAFAMAVTGEGKAMLPIFQEVYPKVDRETKLQIIQALGHFGGADALPFLLEIMGTEFYVLRIASASAIIRAING
ncbi:MAG: HEAT repeat domain-containing protein [Simkaniaceae bacterium]|nr:HEAT repeat domain-containing protein [Simkaniaceae bacterium]